MTQDIIINYLTEHKEQFKKDFGITKIGLFGSYARNEAKNDSDIDILIELKKDLTDIYEKKSLLKEEYIIKSKNYFDKYGAFSILFSWLPIVGDPITFVAGILKYDFKKFLILVIVAKFSRYLFLALII